MQLRDRSTGNLLTLDTDAPLGRGGEAQVCLIPGMPDKVAKIYVPGKATTERARKLAVMLANPPEAPQSGGDHVPLAWPHSLLTPPDDPDTVVGFLMPRAHGVAQAIDYYHPQRRLEFCPLFDYRYLLRTARNLAAATRTVHARGYVIGDLKHSNVLVSQTALVTLVDTDSFQVRDPQTGCLYPCQVGTPDYTPPERQNDNGSAAPLTPEHDLFALGVLIFQLLMEGTHPFASVYTGEGDPPAFEERIAAGHFPYGANPGPYHPGRRTAPSYDILPLPLQALFLRCFDAGHADPTARPDAQTWQVALDAACGALTCCADGHSHHFYSDHLSVCPWCVRRDTQLRGLDPFPNAISVPNPAVRSTGIVLPHVFPTPSTSLAFPAASPAPRTGGGLLFGWVGVLCIAVCGLSLMSGEFHTATTVSQPSPIIGTTNEQIPEGTLPDSNSLTVYSPQGQYKAILNVDSRQITVESRLGTARMAYSMFRSDNVDHMEFSDDEKSLLIISPAGVRIRWDFIHNRFQNDSPHSSPSPR
jgi:serine/threonine protein kinase